MITVIISKSGQGKVSNKYNTGKLNIPQLSYILLGDRRTEKVQKTFNVKINCLATSYLDLYINS